MSRVKLLYSCVVAALIAISAGGAYAKDSTAPATTTTGKTDAGRAAGVEGGAGATGQSGTDPATLKRDEDQRVQKKTGGKRKNWND